MKAKKCARETRETWLQQDVGTICVWSRLPSWLLKLRLFRKLLAEQIRALISNLLRVASTSYLMVDALRLLHTYHEQYKSNMVSALVKPFISMRLRSSSPRLSAIKRLSIFIFNLAGTQRCLGRLDLNPVAGESLIWVSKQLWRILILSRPCLFLLVADCH